MKRLTGRAPDGTAYLYNMGGTNAAIDRLAAYEDTGMEPEEIKAELDKRRWVPVTERLPEQSGEYLVILYTVPDVARLYYYYAPNEEFGQTRSGVWCAETVTHWMPLPILPSEG